MSMKDEILDRVWNDTFPNWAREESNVAFQAALLRIIDSTLNAMTEATPDVVNAYEKAVDEGLARHMTEPPFKAITAACKEAHRATIDAIKSGR